MTPDPDLDRALNSLRGVAIGDSLGLVYEGLAARRGTRLYPLPLRQRFLFGRGVTSDDTAQSAMIVQSLARHPTDIEAFQTDFAQRLKVWFAAIPPGIGLSTVKACLRLWIGKGPKRSGVPSAGNGAAMRSSVIGAAFAHDPAARIAFVEASTRVTHTHPLAVQGAQLIALAAALSATGQASEFDRQANELCPEWPWEEKWPERGPGGYVLHSVNAGIEVWKENLGWEDAIVRVIQLGGDTDTVGAMVGGILGASGDFSGVKPEWQRTLNWPQPRDYEAIRKGWQVPQARMVLDNLLILPIVLLHGMRRLFPPY